MFSQNISLLVSCLNDLLDYFWQLESTFFFPVFLHAFLLNTSITEYYLPILILLAYPTPHLTYIEDVLVTIY